MPQRGLLDQRNHDVKGGLDAFHDHFAIGAESLHDLGADLRPADAENAQGELAEFEKRECLGDVHAGQRAGEPVDERFLEMLEEVLGKVLDAELGGGDQVADKADRVFDNLANAAPTLRR